MTTPQGVIPHLVVNDAAAALAFYAEALGAVEIMRMPTNDGKSIMHAEITVNGATIFVRDDFPDYRKTAIDNSVLPPNLAGSTSVELHLEVPDCDEAVARAVAAGAIIHMPVDDMFWGARYGSVIDPFGHGWSFAHPLDRKA